MQRLGISARGLGKTVKLAREAGVVTAMLSVLVLAGCRQDMHNQPKFVPQRGTDFPGFSGRSSRPQVENTVGRDQMHADAYFYTGIESGKEGDGLPIPLTTATMERGQERYNVYCTPCHSRVGNGAGMIVQRGYRPAGNFHTDRLRNAPLGHFFAVITNGYGAMPDYSAQLTPEDRWAVVAYVRALQLSQAAKPSDVASGGHVQDLHAIAQDAGMPPGFADPWAVPSALPMTAVYGTSNPDDGIPGQAINTPPDGAMGRKGQRAGQGNGNDAASAPNAKPQ